MQGAVHPVEEEIIRYVKDNPGCSKSDIVRFIKGKQMMGRPAVLVHIDKLERERMINCELERPNSQIYKVYVNEDNKIASVLVDLEDFKKAYSNLLKKSKERIDNKDYSKVAKLFNLEETDPAKWDEKDRVKYIMTESEKLVKHTHADAEHIMWENRSKENFKKLEKQIEKTYQDCLDIQNELNSETNSKRKNDLILKRHNILSNLEADILELQPLLDNKIQSLYNVKDYEVVFLLKYAVGIYYWFVEIMVFRTIFVWPNNINDTQTLSNIYSVVFRIISEIQIQLSEFYKTNKIGFIYSDPIENIALNIKLIRELNIRLYYLPQYQILDMKSEIKSVINSLLKLTEEVKNYDFIDMSDIGIGFTDDIDIALEKDEGIKEFLKQIEKTKNITEVKVDSSEYQHDNQMILHAIEKVIRKT
jgi:hypothetical protein